MSSHIGLFRGSRICGSGDRLAAQMKTPARWLDLPGHGRTDKEFDMQQSTTAPRILVGGLA